jgi:hypothetical protein
MLSVLHNVRRLETYTHTGGHTGTCTRTPYYSQGVLKYPSNLLK